MKYIGRTNNLQGGDDLLSSSCECSEGVSLFWAQPRSDLPALRGVIPAPPN